MGEMIQLLMKEHCDLLIYETSENEDVNIAEISLASLREDASQNYRVLTESGNHGNKFSFY